MNKPRAWGLLLGALLLLTGIALGAMEGVSQIEELQAKERLLSAVTERVRQGAAEEGPRQVNRPLVAERVNLPDVEGHFWLTFLYQDGWRKDAETVRLHNMFLNDARLVEMRRRCRVNSFGQMDKYLVERWRKYVGNQTPMLVLQAPDGQLCFKASRGNIPASADELVTQIQQSLDERFRRPCPQPEPAPVQPQPTPIAPVSPLPDTVVDQPADEPKDSGDPLWLLAVLGVSGVAIGALVGRRRR